MEVVTGAMGTLLPKLGDLLKEEYKLQKGVRGEIKFLEAELECMQAALLKISEVPIDQPPDIQLKLWARDVRELSYDLEDSIDKFMVRIHTRVPAKPHSFRGFIDRSINLLTKAKIHHKIGTDIKDIKSRISEVKERHDRYKVDNVVAKPAGATIDSLRLSALYKKAAELIGTEEKSDGLIKRLMEGDEASKQHLKIVSIVGFGGLGKKTLANLVYQKLRPQFDCEVFVSVSLNPNMEKIFKNMLHQLGKDSNIDDEAQLIRELRELLQNKRPHLNNAKYVDYPSMEVVFAQGAMQNLQILELTVEVWRTMDRLGDFNHGLENLSSLERVIVFMVYCDTRPREVEAAEAAIRKALDMNPNRPTLQLFKHKGTVISGELT